MSPKIKELQNRNLPEEEDNPQIDEIPLENVLQAMKEIILEDLIDDSEEDEL